MLPLKGSKPPEGLWLPTDFTLLSLLPNLSTIFLLKQVIMNITQDHIFLNIIINLPVQGLAYTSAISQEVYIAFDYH